MSHVNASFNGVALDDSTKETSSEGITSTIGVNNPLAINPADREGLNTGFGRTVGGHNDRGESALGDDNNAGAGGVLLGENRNCFGDLSDVGGLDAGNMFSNGRTCSRRSVHIEVVGLGVSKSFRFVTN